MTALEAIAANEAKVAIDTARRRHERAAMIAHREGRLAAAYREADAVRRLQRFGPSETLVVTRLPHGYGL